MALRLANEQLLLSARSGGGWLAALARRNVDGAPQQNCGRYADTGMTQLVRCAILMLVGLALACENHPWEGIVEPKTGTIPFYVAIGHFRTLEECRAAAIAVLAKTRSQPGESPDYECGRDCEISTIPPPTGFLPLRTCKETSR